MSYIKHYIYVNAFFNGFENKTDAINVDLIEKILCPDPAKRISPIEIIKHPFCIAAN